MVVATLDDGAGHVGRGEGTPIYYHGETAEGCLAQLLGLDLRPSRSGEGSAWGLSSSDEPARGGQPPPPAPSHKGTGAPLPLPRGAARNALDAALWDLRAEQTGRPVWSLAGLAQPRPLTTAFTISLGDPDRMEADARAAAGRYPLLKLKLAGEGDGERVAAVRRGAPGARLIVDANEAWTGLDVAAQAAALVPFGVELIEQPVAAGRDAELDGVRSPIPLCADESCQDRADLPRLIGRYDAVNVKLDKAGGLTESLALIAAARADGLEVMVGCMLSTSLGIAPAFLAAQGARWVDLDGPLLLARDRDDGIRFDGSTMQPPPPALWG